MVSTAPATVGSLTTVWSTGDLVGVTGTPTVVDGVAHAPGGSHPTACVPDRARDLPFLQAYVDSAGEDGGWERWRAEWLDGDEAAYQRRVNGSEVAR